MITASLAVAAQWVLHPSTLNRRNVAYTDETACEWSPQPVSEQAEHSHMKRLLSAPAQNPMALGSLGALISQTSPAWAPLLWVCVTLSREPVTWQAMHSQSLLPKAGHPIIALPTSSRKKGTIGALLKRRDAWHFLGANRSLAF